MLDTVVVRFGDADRRAVLETNQMPLPDRRADLPIDEQDHTLGIRGRHARITDRATRVFNDTSDSRHRFRAPRAERVYTLPMKFTHVPVMLLVAVVSAAAQIPKAPFTREDAEAGTQLVATSLELRAQIKDTAAPADPFRILGNLYFVGSANGESYLLTSPQGHILLGAGFEAAVDRTQKNIEALGFKMSDIKAILLNH